ncbi:MAG TPA: DUF1501 domain-containing protein [Pyrinomonadaceae bacterium]|jgi:uncharacterized protein (DUF1501 family)|nr:DUF1501 domain-containing protein [Pyrinomonadaceae bacterium]
MSINRRFFLKSGGIALASFGLMQTTPSFLQRMVLAREEGRNGSANRRKTLITIFQRGAVDGLNMVVPYGERAYYELRPSLAIPGPRAGGGGGAEEAALELDGFFGLHPSLAPLKPLWDAKRLAIVEAVGSPDNTRSHFDAQDYMESGTPGRKSTADGWLNRLLQSQPEAVVSPFRAVSLTQNLPRALQGRAPALAITNLADFAIRAGQSSASVQGGFEAMYDQGVADVLRGTGRETFEAINFLKKVNPAQYRAENGAQYPRGPFGSSLLQIAQLIKAGVGLEVAFTESGGWDTHVNQGGARGQLALRLQELGAGIGALARDLGARMDDVVILTMSEFGRTVRENGNRGTDHGHANAMLVIGNSVRGGRVYGQWPGLSSDQLHEGRDLALTTDFRDVLGELAQKHLGNSNLQTIFPGYAASARDFRGIL